MITQEWSKSLKFIIVNLVMEGNLTFSFSLVLKKIQITNSIQIVYLENYK